VVRYIHFRTERVPRQARQTPEAGSAGCKSVFLVPAAGKSSTVASNVDD
jgi:hypothetical protein